MTAAYGIEGFTDGHRAAFRKYGTERVLIAYDRDAAGDTAAEKLAAELAGIGIEVMRVVFPKGMDANEYALKVQPAAQSLGLVLRQATWMAGVRRNGESRSAAETAPTPPASEAASEPATAVQPEPNSFLAAEPASMEPVSEEAEQVSASAAEPINEPARAEATSAMEMAGIASLSLETRSTPAPPPEAPPLCRMTAREVSRLADELGTEVADNAVPLPPPLAPSSPSLVASGDEVSFQFGDRRWRVRGLPSKPQPGSLHVNLLCSREGGAFHVDTLELYSARQRAHFTKLTSDELTVEERVIKRDLARCC